MSRLRKIIALIGNISIKDIDFNVTNSSIEVILVNEEKKIGKGSNVIGKVNWSMQEYRPSNEEEIYPVLNVSYVRVEEPYRGTMVFNHLIMKFYDEVVYPLFQEYGDQFYMLAGFMNKELEQMIYRFCEKKGIKLKWLQNSKEEFNDFNNQLQDNAEMIALSEFVNSLKQQGFDLFDNISFEETIGNTIPYPTIKNGSAQIYNETFTQCFEFFIPEGQFNGFIDNNGDVYMGINIEDSSSPYNFVYSSRQNIITPKNQRADFVKLSEVYANNQNMISNLETTFGNQVFISLDVNEPSYNLSQVESMLKFRNKTSRLVSNK